jgi:tRNA (mo5U34)-methyltransferase
MSVDPMQAAHSSTTEASPSNFPASTRPSLAAEVQRLGPWFHNLHLPDGTQTVPDHTFGDFPRNKWQTIAGCLPDRLDGCHVLDIGCNAGFYSFELAMRGAQVTAIDHDPHYLEQARWAARVLGLDRQIEFQHKQVYDLAHEPERYDLVWFMGVFYHLRYPLLGLDIVSRITRRMLVFQTLTMPGDQTVATPRDMPISERERMLEPGWPVMAFIENRLAQDPTNWWAPNDACVQAMLRSCGWQVVQRPGHEIYICEPGEPYDDGIRGHLDAEFRSATGSRNPSHETS